VVFANGTVVVITAGGRIGISGPPSKSVVGRI